MPDRDGPGLTMDQESRLTGQAGTSVRGDESRAAILQAAKALFSANGSRGTSLASIASAAGLSQPGLLHHFPSKSALLLAVLADRDREDGELSSARLTGDGLDILTALASLVEHNQGQPEIVRLFSVLLDPQWQGGTECAIDVTLCGRYYERFCDHAVSVARRVVFLVTGERRLADAELSGTS